jgi:hypothetical protein
MGDLASATRGGWMKRGEPGVVVGKWNEISEERERAGFCAGVEARATTRAEARSERTRRHEGPPPPPPPPPPLLPLSPLPSPLHCRRRSLDWPGLAPKRRRKRPATPRLNPALEVI